jgi:hypothetical protein
MAAALSRPTMMAIRLTSTPTRLHRAGLETVTRGQRVAFGIKRDPRNGQLVADNLIVLEAAPGGANRVKSKMPIPPIHCILWERDKAWERVIMALAEEQGVLSADGRIPAHLHYKVQNAAEPLYREWSIRMQGWETDPQHHKRPVMRTKSEICLAELYQIDHPKAF